MAEEINITINPDGTFSYKVAGVKGKSCKELTKYIDGMAVGPVTDKLLEEYHQAEIKKQTNGQ